MPGKLVQNYMSEDSPSSQIKFPAQVVGFDLLWIILSNLIGLSHAQGGLNCLQKSYNIQILLKLHIVMMSMKLATLLLFIISSIDANLLNFMNFNFCSCCSKIFWSFSRLKHRVVGWPWRKFLAHVITAIEVQLQNEAFISWTKLLKCLYILWHLSDFIIGNNSVLDRMWLPSIEAFAIS